MPDSREENTVKTAKWQTFAVLLVGNLVWLFANGRWRVDALAWIFPFLILLFLHQNKLWRGILLCLVGVIYFIFQKKPVI